MAAGIGILGLGVMGRNLGENLLGRGVELACYDPWPEARSTAPGRVADTPEQFVALLARPRIVLLMVKAGRPVDDAIARLLPLLEPGDVVIDGGNSHYQETERRGRLLAGRGIDFLGTGISGGEEGARLGPSIMAGGPSEAYRRVEPMLTAIAARVQGQPCCAHVGPGGAGHFVKMIHNGIEYADMQIIAEGYQILRDLCGLEQNALADAFQRWNAGDLKSYLIEITAEILRYRDPLTGLPLADLVLDRAGQKGTGQWASVAALELDVPAPTIVEAVVARGLSALKAERVAAAGIMAGPAAAQVPPGEAAALATAVGDAMLAAKICAYAQGFALLAKASETYGWSLDLARIAEIWRGGCIIRSRLLDDMAAAFRQQPSPANLMVAERFQALLAAAQAPWRRVVGAAVAHGVSIPALGSALAYHDAYRTGRLWANLLQCQRDYFGAHGYERIDRPGSFHTAWSPQ